MGTRSRTSSSASITASHQAQVVVPAAELAAASGISPTTLERLVRLGLVEPVAPGANEFTAATAVRLRRMLRLHRDLGLSMSSAATIVDLMERLEHLESELTRLKSSRRSEG